ncbi:MAG: imidazolonepropionase [Anaerolineales bacterium]|nr:imidazolonepropionase [Anaerolineales bacterium]
MLIHSANQLLTLTETPQRGHTLGELGLISNGALAVNLGRIIASGKSEDFLSRYHPKTSFDAGGKVVLPGFVDPHTHLVWAGDRALEFEQRLAGKSYMEIMASGGGIISTVNKTRAASVEQLISETLPRLDQMLTHGTTTAEVKTGYGLNTETEIKLLETILQLDELHPVDLVPTFLGAHAVPPEYKGQTDRYTDLVCNEMLPAVKRWWLQRSPQRTLPFVDVFCEEGAFDLAQSRRILETAQDLGFPLKIHADEFKNLGGTALAATLNAASADHLVVTPEEEILRLGASDTVAVSLPNTPFGLASPAYTPAKQILEAGGILALATDLNPGTAWGESMQFALALACRYLRLTPAEAIAAATINAAAAIRIEQDTGSLANGKKADILVLNAPDYRHLGYRFGVNLVETVFKYGQIVSAFH